MGYYTMVDDKQRHKALELYGDAIRQPENSKDDTRKKDDEPDNRTESTNGKIEIRHIARSEDIGFIVANKKVC